MYATRSLPPSNKLLPAIAFLAATVGAAPTVVAQERRTSDEGGFDPRRAVIFEDSASNTLETASSPDGKLRAESGINQIRVYSVEQNELLHEFATSDNTNSPLFTDDGTKLIAAVCRGNLGCISTLYSWDLKTGQRTRWGECSGMVLDIGTDANGKRLAVTTYYGPISTKVLADRKSKWIGGEIVVFDTAKLNAPVRIFCELPGIPSFLQLAKEANDMGLDSDELNANLNKTLTDANRRCLPVRVGLTPDGDKVIGITSTGVVRVFDAETGTPELVLSSQARVASELLGSGEE